MDVGTVVHFTEVGKGTKLAIQFDPHPKGVMKVLFPILKPLIKRDLVKQHLKFKEFCESQTESRSV